MQSAAAAFLDVAAAAHVVAAAATVADVADVAAAAVVVASAGVVVAAVVYVNTSYLTKLWMTVLCCWFPTLDPFLVMRDSLQQV